MLLLLALLAGVSVCIVVLSFIVAFRYGIEARNARAAFSNTSETYFDARERHFRFLRIYFGFLVLAVVLIELIKLMMRSAGIETPITLLNIVHYTFDIWFFIQTVLVLRFNGLLSEKHAMYVRKLFVPSIGVLATGLPLYIRLLMALS